MVLHYIQNTDLSSKKTGDVFRLKLYGIEYDVKVVGDDEDPLMFCKDCIFLTTPNGVHSQNRKTGA